MSLFQTRLFEQSTEVKIALDEDHELVRMTRLIDWDGLIVLAMRLRSKKVKRESGPEPHYRALLGAVVLMAVKKLGFRDAEDLIYHYAPAKYLCDLMDSDWRLDHVTIFDFTKMMGADGMELINQEILDIAEEHGFLDPRELMSDTTAQEAKIPYPNEVGLMARFMELLSSNLKKVGGKFQEIKGTCKETAEKIKGLVRNSHLFAKTKEEKRKVAKKMYHLTKEIQKTVAKLLAQGSNMRSKAGKEIARLNDVMNELLPQMLHFIQTGFVASKKIIHLQLSELYAISRGKAGKKVEFGLKWGINRIGGGFLQGFLLECGKHFSDQKFCMGAVDVHKATFGIVPSVFGFDRGGYSEATIKKLKKAGIKHVGVAPKGKADWEVSDAKREYIKRERAQVEGCIGTIKSPIYGFNKPDARSTAAMVTYGQRAITGFNMRKVVKEVRKLELAGS